ncbi:C2 calcium/lipid-binding plant phosphoribosyltransferase family protein [Rhynchospora pubera]|uniref:C2 calcium/lipid-binding plant phosphoribosyltransferase family protein n=1 Tax=Rhynchospora pubera TaxID=906938 RepID=A0AAV8CU39_9POAL|nr:C2 calcium/lipid-binding plant phosphoribosyltransferase family protein [Rhynchospora pubera]KAJ4811839.1 C2 calcium/lipid-binding plant phosphoribosyltransferase family protein [Rhynchospora pubera]
MARSEQASYVRSFSAMSASQSTDFMLKETAPRLGGGFIGSDKLGAYDLVEKMSYLYVRVVKARELPGLGLGGGIDPYVELRLGNYKGTTRHFEKNHSPEWNEVFAFSRERIQASHLEVWLGSKGLVEEERVAYSRFDLTEIPTRVPPDSPLAPEWYRLVDREGKRISGELMLAVWHGTQADECFPNAIHAEETHAVDARINTLIKGKVYPSPRLWYTRLQVFSAQDIYATNRSPHGQVFVKARVGNQLLKTKVCRSTTLNYEWNEHLVFVCAEPFEELLEISVEEHIEVNKHKVIGHCHLPLRECARRTSHDHIIKPSWYDLKRGEEIKEEKFSAKINLCVIHEGGYHVMAESTHYSSDLRPSSKDLWRQPIGLLELGVLRAEGLAPMRSKDNKGTCDAYCVAKYGDKWCRTRTIIDNLSPRFNEQYTWDVHDHSTVITICVYHNCLIEKGAKDLLIGKVRIRLSTLETDRIYTHAYPLISLHHSGVKKMGELHLAVRFSSTSWSNLLYSYAKPHLPTMHYIQPINLVHQEYLRERAMEIVAHRMSRMEPPLRREVVEEMCDMRSHLWSMRRSRANFYRLITVLSGCFRIVTWINDICCWKNPVTTSLVHILFAMLVAFPNLILPTCFLYMFLICLWNFRFRPRYPPHMNTKISFAETIHHDELAEEFDSFPTSQSPEIVKMRYDRLRSLAGRIQTIVGDFATHGERIHALFTWRDPRATAMFLCWCLCMAIVMYTGPFQLVVLCLGFYMMRHPRLRYRMPSPVMNYFRRLPSKTDCLI